MNDAQTTEFTPSEFNQQAVEFRRMMGDKTFWALPEEKRDLAVKGLGFAYLFVKGDKDTVARCAQVLQDTLAEYTRRHLMLLRIGGKVGA